MNDKETKTDERKIDFERERLELDKQRLRLDVESHETSTKLDSERIALEKSKERTTKLQIVLPLLFAIGITAFGEYRRYAEARMQREQEYNLMVNSYNQGRLELFKRMTEQTADSAEMKNIKNIYAEIFPNDAKTLEREQTAGRVSGP